MMYAMTVMMGSKNVKFKCVCKGNPQKTPQKRSAFLGTFFNHPGVVAFNKLKVGVFKTLILSFLYCPYKEGTVKRVPPFYITFSKKVTKTCHCPCVYTPSVVNSSTHKKRSWWVTNVPVTLHISPPFGSLKGARATPIPWAYLWHTSGIPFEPLGTYT